MREIRQLLLVALMLCALPLTGRAQWATTRIERDWRLAIAGNSFGLVQEAIYTVSLESPNYRRTTIYLGPVYTTTTRFQASHIALLLLLVGATGLIALAGIRRRT